MDFDKFNIADKQYNTSLLQDEFQELLRAASESLQNSKLQDNECDALEEEFRMQEDTCLKAYQKAERDEEALYEFIEKHSGDEK